MRHYIFRAVFPQLCNCLGWVSQGGERYLNSLAKLNSSRGFAVVMRVGAKKKAWERKSLIRDTNNSDIWAVWIINDFEIGQKTIEQCLTFIYIYKLKNTWMQVIKEESKYQPFNVNCTFQVFLLPLRLPLTLWVFDTLPIPLILVFGPWPFKSGWLVCSQYHSIPWLW